MNSKFNPNAIYHIHLVTELEDEISRAFGILSHLNGVKNSSELRETLEKIQASHLPFDQGVSDAHSKYLHPYIARVREVGSADEPV